MPVKSWLVAVAHDDEQIETVVEAYTEDGAMTACARVYHARFHRIPHESEYLKVEETHVAPTEDSGATRSGGVSIRCPK